MKKIRQINKKVRRKVLGEFKKRPKKCITKSHIVEDVEISKEGNMTVLYNEGKEVLFHKENLEFEIKKGDILTLVELSLGFVEEFFINGEKIDC